MSDTRHCSSYHKAALSCESEGSLARPVSACALLRLARAGAAAVGFHHLTLQLPGQSLVLSNLGQRCHLIRASLKAVLELEGCLKDLVVDN